MTIHVLAAMLWLGGLLFLGVVGAPVLRNVEPLELRQRLFSELGTRFRLVGWIAIAVLVVTGIGNLYFRGLLVWSGGLGALAFWRTGYGHVLATKLLTVAAMIVVSALHDFLLGPRAVRAALAGGADARRLRRHAVRLARLNALLAVLIVIVAVRLAR